MYSSLLKIDITAQAPDGRTQFVQTDHRDAAEMAEEPEISVLFAIARMLGAKAHAARTGQDDVQVVYACMQTPSPAVVEAVAACGGMISLEAGTETAPPSVTVTPGDLADAAFQSLAKRAMRATGLDDYAAALHVVEAQTLAEPPTGEEDEIAYWTRVLELSALTGEIMRAEHGGRWVENTEHADLPFAFAMGTDLMLPTNRASRFIEDGENESMFLMLGSARERRTSVDDQPVLPSLRSRSDVEQMGIVFRPLLERTPDPELPVIAYGHDTPTSFGLLKMGQYEYSEDLHAQAMANLTKQEVQVEDTEIADVPVTVVTGGFFATEKLLDPAFMRQLHRTHGDMMAAIVPTRGLMIVTNAASADPQRAMHLLSLIAEKESQSSRKISRSILLVQEGEVVGHVRLETSPVD